MSRTTAAVAITVVAAIGGAAFWIGKQVSTSSADTGAGGGTTGVDRSVEPVALSTGDASARRGGARAGDGRPSLANVAQAIGRATPEPDYVVATGMPQQELTEAERKEYLQISEYFGEQVRPRVAECFAEVKQPGRVKLRYRFVREPTAPETHFVLADADDAVEVRDSTLPEELDQPLGECMAGAMKDLPLVLDPSEDDGAGYSAYWTWYVGGPQE